MLENRKIPAPKVIDPLGTLLTVDDIPPAGARWTARRNAEVIVAEERGLLTMQDASERYSISIGEFAEWFRAFQPSGLKGLQVTRAQHNREVFEFSRSSAVP